MNAKPLGIAVVLLALLPGVAPSQVSVPPPASSGAPFLYARFQGPEGMRVTLYPGTPEERRYDAPVTVGLRPGYCYRVKLDNFAAYPGVELYPTLEVRGTLQMGPHVNVANYPAPVGVSLHDVDRMAAGALITKVVYLEHPCQAVPVATEPDQPLESEVRPGFDPLCRARELGRPMLLWLAGERTPTGQELLAQSIPCTILFPGDRALGKPPVGPCLPWAKFPVYDPAWGPKFPEEERVCDGGDCGPKAAFGPGGVLAGVDPSDTVAEYADSCHHRKIAVSNRVCICVPRFAVVRAELLPVGYEKWITPNRAEGVLPQVALQQRLPPRLAQQNEQPRALVGREKPTEAAASQGPVEVSKLTAGALILARQHGREIIGSLCEKCPPPDCPLVLCKAVDKGVAQVGDVVTFTLKYTNPGGQPMSDVAVVDSLTGRLEYVVGSQKSDRPAVFTIQENEAGSAKLRWQINGVLPPGQSGVLTFQAKIR